jgi:hypothetical protein
MSLLALVLIVSIVCGLLALVGWIGERKRRPMARYSARWPTPKGWER